MREFLQGVFIKMVFLMCIILIWFWIDYGITEYKDKQKENARWERYRRDGFSPVTRGGIAKPDSIIEVDSSHIYKIK